MKVTCAYCDSYVEADELLCCPLCGAPLGTALKIAEEKEKAEQAARDAQAAALAEAESKEQTKRVMINAAASVIGAVGGSLLGHAIGFRPRPKGGLLRGLGRGPRRF